MFDRILNTPMGYIVVYLNLLLHCIFVAALKSKAGVLKEKEKNCQVFLNFLVLIDWFQSIFYYLGFLSCTLATHRTGGEGREPCFNSLYHFHSLTNIHFQLCMWAYYHIFLIKPLLFTRLLLDEIYHLIELPFYWLTMWCWFLFVYLRISFSVSVTSIWNGKPGNSSSHRVPPLHYKRTD